MPARLQDVHITPSATDITSGGVTLTLTATALTGCTNAISTKALTITKTPTASAGTAMVNLFKPDSGKYFINRDSS